MRFKLSCEGVCVKSLPPPRTSGELPGPFWPLPSRCCLQRKVPVCPSLLNPGEGVMHSRTKQPQSNKTNLHTQTYTDTKVHDHPPPISLGFPVSGGDPGSTAPQGLKGQVQSVARQRPVTPCAQRQGSRGGGASSQPPGERSSPLVGDAAGDRPASLGARGDSKGHDGCAPRVHVPQHWLIAADLPGLGGFRTALRLSLGFLVAAPGAFP